MKRSQFIKTTTAGAIGLPLAMNSFAVNNLFSEKAKDIEVFTAGELNKFLRSLIDVKEPSVDRIIIGNPDLKIKKIGTCWLPDWNTLKKAVVEGVNVRVVHEPTFYTHWDLENTTGDFYKAPDHARKQYLALLEEKKRWILENNLVLIRCHDVLDKLKEIGIPFAFGTALGFQENDILREEAYYGLGWSYFRIENFRKSSEIFNKMLQEFPD